MMLKSRFVRSSLLSALCLSLAGFGPVTLAQEGQGAAEQLTQEQIEQEAEQNIKYLSGHVLRKAKGIMEQYGEFAPYGAALFPNGKVRYVWAVPPGSDQDFDPVTVLTAVRQALRAQAQNGAILGSAVIYQYLPQEAAEQGDKPQINVETEYLNGHAVVTATKYEMEDGELTFGAASQQEFEPRIFVPKEG